ncbi:SPOSA6832_01544, partial [Sporobolomyces salmonicolor]
MLSSSPRPESHLHRSGAPFHGQPLVVPSSPSAAYQDGEISPSFDASFASSMSITSDERTNPSPCLTNGRSAGGASSPMDLMDISPAPAGAGRQASAARSPPNLRSTAFLARTCSQPVTTSTTSLAQPESSSAHSDHPFLKSLFRVQQSAPPTQTTFAPIAPLSIPRATYPDEVGDPAIAPVASTSSSTISLLPSSSTVSRGHSRRPSLPHFKTVPPSQTEKLHASFSNRTFQFKATVSGVEVLADDGVFNAGKQAEETTGSKRSPDGMEPPKSPDGMRWRPGTSAYARETTQAESSPFRMDIDGASPHGKLASPISLRPPGHPRSVSDSRAYDASKPLFPSSPEPSQQGDFSDIFESPDLSPIPQSRKRYLEQENSPTPASPTPVCNAAGGSLGAAGGRRVFEKGNTVGSAFLRKQRSAIGLSINRRPSIASFSSLGSGTSAASTSAAPSDSASASSSFNKRLATQAQDGKPAPARRNVGRAHSVADAAEAGFQLGLNSNASSGLSERDPNVPVSPHPARASVALDGCDYFGAVGRRAGAAIDLGPAVAACLSPESGSPIAGFRQQEAKGKALPCFNVKEDGLMRISPDTLNALQSGQYRQGIKSYHVIDCRFDYEYEGGHIAEAINLSEMADVENALLNIDNLPAPSTSETAPAEGKTHLRNVDRLRNHAAYPKVHYPEVYILQGGYEAFYKAYPERCVGDYVVMDHPEHDAKRTVNLDKFRRQKGIFNRASSYTFGQAQHASAMLRNADVNSANPRRPVSLNPRKPLEPAGFQFPARAPMATTPSAPTAAGSTLAIHEEDHEGDSSFGTNCSSPCGGANNGSPCPPTSKTLGRQSLKLMKEPIPITSKLLNTRRPMTGRAQTSGILTFAR